MVVISNPNSTKAILESTEYLTYPFIIDHFERESYGRNRKDKQ